MASWECYVINENESSLCLLYGLRVGGATVLYTLNAVISIIRQYRTEINTT